MMSARLAGIFINGHMCRPPRVILSFSCSEVNIMASPIFQGYNYPA